MTDVLGYQRYGAFGGDIGGVVTGWLGALYPEQVVGIHMIHPPFPAQFDSHPLSAAEQAYLDAEATHTTKTDSGYSAIMGTRPDTIAAALIDSPVGTGRLARRQIPGLERQPRGSGEAVSTGIPC